jgi:hypothetical protein
MYTVLRFSGPQEQLAEFGRQTNTIRPGTYDRPDRGVANRFSISVADSDNWSQHYEEIVNFLRELYPVLECGRQSGFSAQLDIALMPDDYSARLLASWWLGEDFIELLHQSKIKLWISTYGKWDLPQE